MADLKVNYCGVEYRNPLIMASSTPGWDGEGLLKAARAGAGGVVPKTIGPKADWADHPHNGRMFLPRYNGRPIGLVDLELFTTKTRDEWISKDLAMAKSGGAVMHVSILAMPNPDDTARLVEEIQSTGMADLLELNCSCPMPAEKVGMHIGKNADLTYAQVKAASSVARIPLTMKMTPEVTDIAEIATAAEEAGAKGLTISNSQRCLAGVDIETGHLYLRAFGGYEGPAIHPVIMRCVAEAAKAVKIPVSAAGGVSGFREVVEYIMLGATTVQVATAVLFNGYKFITETVKNLNDWMDKKGYKTCDEFRGIALPELTTVEKLAQEAPRYSSIDKLLCVNCGRCETSCFYRAISEKDGCRIVDQSKCDGCGICAQLCPKGAATLR